jgi:hypothetical protein
MSEMSESVQLRRLAVRHVTRGRPTSTVSSCSSPRFGPVPCYPSVLCYVSLIPIRMQCMLDAHIRQARSTAAPVLTIVFIQESRFPCRLVIDLATWFVFFSFDTRVFFTFFFFELCALGTEPYVSTFRRYMRVSSCSPPSSVLLFHNVYLRIFTFACHETY